MLLMSPTETVFANTRNAYNGSPSSGVVSGSECDSNDHWIRQKLDTVWSLPDALLPKIASSWHALGCSVRDWRLSYETW